MQTSRTPSLNSNVLKKSHEPGYLWCWDKLFCYEWECNFCKKNMMGIGDVTGASARDGIAAHLIRETTCLFIKSTAVMTWLRLIKEPIQHSLLINSNCSRNLIGLKKNIIMMLSANVHITSAGNVVGKLTIQKTVRRWKSGVWRENQKARTGYWQIQRFELISKLCCICSLMSSKLIKELTNCVKYLACLHVLSNSAGYALVLGQSIE